MVKRLVKGQLAKMRTEAETFQQAATMYLDKIGKRHASWADDFRGYGVQTTAGYLEVHIWDDWISTQFQEEELIWPALNESREKHGFAPYTEPNHQNGQWNFHFGDFTGAEGEGLERVAHFQKALDPILPLVPVPGKGKS